MNKNLIIGLAVIAVLLILALAFGEGKKKPGGIVDESGFAGHQGSEQTKQAGIDVAGKTMRDLIEGKLGENVKCEFSQVIAEGNRLDGVTYIAGKKLRSDYKLAVPEQGQKDLHMISDGEYGYVWGDSFIGQAMQGSKFKINAGSGTTGNDADANAQSPDYDTPLVKCEAWDPEASLFDIPDDVNFADLEALQQSATQSMGGQNCAMCDSLPEEQKIACRKSLDCEAQ